MFQIDKCADKYEFGYNGQMKVNEVAGVGNWNTAEFWEYNTRTGVRANVDPKPVPWESPYAVNRNNPVLTKDEKGDFAPLIAGLVVGLIKSGVEYGGQVASNLAQGKSFKKAFVSDVDFADVGTSGLAGFMEGVSFGALTPVAEGFEAVAHVSVDYKPNGGKDGGLKHVFGGGKSKENIIMDAINETVGFGAGKLLNKAGIERFTKYGAEKLRRTTGKEVFKVIEEQAAQGAIKEFAPFIEDVSRNEYLKRNKVEIGPLQFDGFEEVEE